MVQAMFAKAILALALVSTLIGAQQSKTDRMPQPMPQPPHPWVAACDEWDEWDKPGPAFQVYGNTYYVGTCGIASILITSDNGHVLIDSGTEAGADIVLSNIRSLGFDPADIKLLLNSHEHFDHVGGMAKIQDATGAVIISSWPGLMVMGSGNLEKDDPQFGEHEPMPPIVSKVEPYPALPFHAAEAQYLMEAHGVWPIATPGHSPGAMSWTWRACEKKKCLTIVYADSLSAVSSESYRFSEHKRYVTAFFASLDRIAAVPCNILLTPHPSAGSLSRRLKDRDLANEFSHGGACQDYASKQRSMLLSRLQKEDPEFANQFLPTRPTR